MLQEFNCFPFDPALPALRNLTVNYFSHTQTDSRLQKGQVGWRSPAKSFHGWMHLFERKIHPWLHKVKFMSYICRHSIKESFGGGNENEMESRALASVCWC